MLCSVGAERRYRMENKRNRKSGKKKETMEANNINPINSANVFSDVLGSYTGVLEEGGTPIQDADDL